MTFALDDYVEVADRIAEFYRKFPDGRLWAEELKNDAESVKFKGFAGRTPDDPRPATGHSELAKPGTTPYTRGSEVENCETSAIGRAIVMAGIPSKKVASANEVRAKVVQMPKAVPTPKTLPTPTADENGWAAVVAAAPQPPPHGGWKEGEVHDPGHRPLRARANGSLYCPTKLEDGRWCAWSTAANPK